MNSAMNTFWYQVETSDSESYGYFETFKKALAAYKDSRSQSKELMKVSADGSCRSLRKQGKFSWEK